MSSGVLPVLPLSGQREDENGAKQETSKDVTSGASAAGVRALTTRIAAFYFRAPVRSFFRTRVDYLAYPRALALPGLADSATKYSLRQTTPYILYHTLTSQPASFFPLTVLPPLLANLSVSTSLYTIYLTSLSIYHPPSSTASKRTYPPPPSSATLLAGLTAGTLTAFFAAPFDALTVRFRTSDLAAQRYPKMWSYAHHTIRRIGLRGACAGLALSVVKDGPGAAAFFCAFETVKAQGFYAFLKYWYGLGNLSGRQREEVSAARYRGAKGEITPHYMIEPGFLVLAGAAASVAQSVIMQPLGKVQELYWGRVGGVDRRFRDGEGARRVYRDAYKRVLRECSVLARRDGGWRRWLFNDFWMSTLRQVPSTSAGLIVFEIVRRKYGFEGEAKKLYMDGYDILLP